jgi:alpha-1,2-mannosyltransferase
VLAALLFLLSLTAYLVDQAVHKHVVLSWYDLNVYNDAGLITRQLPAILYTWELKVGIQFTYTPFAALIFAGGSMLKFSTLRWIMTSTSLAAIPLTAWLTLGGMGKRGAGRLAATLAVSALALWIEPVTKAMFLGQIEPLLMLLVVWDVTRSDERRWKGVGIGLAAGIKLVPLIFIPYLLLSGKVRQAGVATASFAATVLVGFLALPGPSGSYWLTGYFMRPGRTGSVHSLVNQSLLGFIARLYGTVGPAQGVWLPLALAVAIVGVVGGAMLSRSGRPVPGWILVGITSVLVSPISWDHHWVWIVPVMAMLAGLTMSARPLAKTGYVVAILALAGVLGAWPWRYSGPHAWVPARGLLGWFIKPPQITLVHAVHGWQLLTWNLWIAVGSVIYLTLATRAVVVWRQRRRAAARPAGDAPVTGGRVATSPAATSPVLTSPAAKSPVPASPGARAPVAGSPAAGGPAASRPTASPTVGRRPLPRTRAGRARSAQPAPVPPAAPSPIDALLARADAILKAGGGILGPDEILSGHSGPGQPSPNGAPSHGAGSNGAGSSGAGSNGAGSNGAAKSSDANSPWTNGSGAGSPAADAADAPDAAGDGPVTQGRSPGSA